MGSTQGIIPFFRGTFFFLAPLWNRLGLLLTKDSLAFFRGRADCGDVPKTPFLGKAF